MTDTNNTLLLGFPDYAPQARALAVALNAAYGEVDIHRFPDGENRIRLPAQLPERVILCRSLNDPNAKLVELLLAAATARELGARQLMLVAPYLCYMRQDKAFQPGEAVSQRIVGQWLAQHFDTVISVDPHLHRVHSLSEAVPAQQTLTVSAAPLLGRYAAEHFDNPLLLGPDEESTQWVEAAAHAGKLDSAVAHKQRRDDLSVVITLPELNVHGRNVVLIDDMASTGRTLARTTEALYERGASAVHALVTHALFAGDAETHLQAAGLRSLHSTDSITHHSNSIALAGLLAAACKEIL